MKFTFRTAAAHVALAAAALLASGACLAKVIDVQLTGAEETPPVTTQATGEAKITINDDHTVRGVVTTHGIHGIAAHIHLGEPGKAGPPIIFLKKGAHGTWHVPPGAKLTDEQYQAFLNGNLYVNVHSPAHKGGEIRAQLK